MRDIINGFIVSTVFAEGRYETAILHPVTYDDFGTVRRTSDTDEAAANHMRAKQVAAEMALPGTAPAQVIRRHVVG